MAIASINSINEGSIASFTGVAKENIANIDGQSFPVDSISLSSSALYYDTTGVAHGDDFVIVTSSGSWSAAITDDPNSMIDSFTSAGANGESLQVTVLLNSSIQDCHSATIRVTKGTVFEDLIIYQDGTVITCS